MPQSGQHPLLAGLFPEDVAVAWLEGSPALEPEFEEERDAIAGAVESRRRQFLAGRQCARAALATLGAPATPLPRSESGEPVWPGGFVGTISHTKGLVAAAVAREGAIRGLGLDIERGPVRSPSARLICTDEERATLARLAPEERAARLAVIFSAKEALYKALPPDLAERAGFHTVTVTVEVDAERLAFRPAGSVLDDRALPREGRCRATGGYVITTVTRTA